MFLVPNILFPTIKQQKSIRKICFSEFYIIPVEIFRVINKKLKEEWNKNLKVKLLIKLLLSFKNLIFAIHRRSFQMTH